MRVQESVRSGVRRRWWVLVVVAIIVIGAVTWILVRNASDIGSAGSPPSGSSSDDGGAAGDGGAPTESGAPTDGQAAPTPTSSPGADEVAPTPGETAPIEKPPSTEEVPFDEQATVAEDLIVEAVSVEGVTAGRDIPGEVSGPAVKVVIRVQNDGSETVDTSGASVNLTYGDDDRTPAVELSDPTSSMLPSSLPAGDAAEAVYIFAVPLEDAGNVRIMVDVLASEPDVVFEGPRP